jgi:hypothetical protein
MDESPEGRRLRKSYSAKVQIGAELLCKSAKVRGKIFQVSGLGSQVSGTGAQVRVQVRDLKLPDTRTCT